MAGRRPPPESVAIQLRRAASWARDPSGRRWENDAVPPPPPSNHRRRTASSRAEEREQLLMQLAELQVEQNESLRMLLLLRLEQFMIRYRQMMDLLTLVEVGLSTPGYCADAEQIISSLEVRRTLNRISLDVLDTLSALSEGVGSGAASTSTRAGASPEFIDGLPEVDHWDDEGECPICLSSFQSEQVKIMPCSHAFHSTCLGTWLASSCACPLCRREAT